VPATSVLPIHLRLIAALKLRLLAILVCMPNDIETSEVPGYRQFGRRMPDGLPLEVLQMPNNSLGSYGEFLHAFATTRGRFDYYIMTEEDYVPSNPYVTDELVRIYRLAFPGKQYGMLAGVLQGQPVEKSSSYSLHAEGSHIMSASSLSHLFDHTYSTVGWKGSMADRMSFLRNASKREHPCFYFSGVQLGFGLLLSDAGILIRDWVSHYRTPYWNHGRIFDWSAAATNFSYVSLKLAHRAIEMGENKLAAQGALFVPVQWLFEQNAVVCCYPTDLCTKAALCNVNIRNVTALAKSPPSCCAANSLPSSHDLRVRRLMSVPIPWKREKPSRCEADFADVLHHSISIDEARRIAFDEAKFARDEQTRIMNLLTDVPSVV